jgi:hypothetical protein
MSVTVTALNRVNDYDAWRKTYSKADFRQAAGITPRSCFRRAPGDAAAFEGGCRTKRFCPACLTQFLYAAELH